MKYLIDWVMVCIVAAAIAFCCIVLVKSVRAQDAQTQGEYTYEGYKYKTKLKGNWSGDKPPGSNDRLYEYDERNIKTGTYYEHNGYEWKQKGDAKKQDLEGGDAYGQGNDFQINP